MTPISLSISRMAPCGHRIAGSATVAQIRENEYRPLAGALGSREHDDAVERANLLAQPAFIASFLDDFRDMDTGGFPVGYVRLQEEVRVRLFHIAIDELDIVQGKGQIHRNRRFTRAPFAAGHRNDHRIYSRIIRVPHSGQFWL